MVTQLKSLRVDTGKGKTAERTQFVAIPLGLATGLSGFTSLVKEVRKLALRLGISVHMLQHNWLIRASSCQRLILQLFVRVGSWGDSLQEVMYLLLQQVSFLGQVFNLSKGVPHRVKVFCLFSSSSFLRIPLVSSPSMHLLYSWLLLRSHFFRVLHAYDTSSVSSKGTLLFLLRCFGRSILDSFCEGFI